MDDADLRSTGVGHIRTGGNQYYRSSCRVSQMARLPLELKAILNGIKVPLQKLFFGELNSSCIIWKWSLNLGGKKVGILPRRSLKKEWLTL